MSNTTHKQHDGCGVEEDACGADGGFEVLCQPPIAPNPREEPLDDPAPRINSEANLTGVLAHDLDRDQGGLRDLLARIPAVGEDPLDEREDAAEACRSGPPPSRSWILVCTENPIRVYRMMES